MKTSKDQRNKVLSLIEDVIDTLIEARNYATDEMLIEATEKMFEVRRILEGKNEN